MNLRKGFERFCYRNRDKGIPNLMLYVVICKAFVLLMSLIDESGTFLSLLVFDRAAILRGQVWRLFSYAFLTSGGSLVLQAVLLLCYYSLGQAVENRWGTLRFNLFYFSGILLMDVYGMIVGYASVGYLDLTLLLAYATIYPDASFLIMFIIPVKAWILALFYLLLALLAVISNPFPINLMPVVGLLNYFLFFGKDVLNIVPMSWQANFRRLFRKTKPGKQPKVVPFPRAGSYEAGTAKPAAPYNHRCTVCGRTDVTNPELEFRYCSKCSGFRCYCIDHISNHTHFE